jgi:hypothetical protein
MRINLPISKPNKTLYNVNPYAAAEETSKSLSRLSNKKPTIESSVEFLADVLQVR